MSEKYNLGILGDACAGKAEIVIQFLKGNVNPMCEECFTKECVIDGVPAKVNIHDNSGQESWNLSHNSVIKSSDGCLLVFSVNNYSSFKKIQNVHKEILRMKDCDRFPMIMVGNAANRSLSKSLNNERKVSTEEAQALASTLNIPYIKCSVEASGINVDEAFYELVRTIRKFRLSKLLACEKTNY